jgi:sulfur carrier protein ThiS
MIKVNINTYGTVNREVGWSSKVIQLGQERVTVEDVLREVNLEGDRTLFDLVANERGIKDGYTVLLNGRTLWNGKDLKKEIKSEDGVTVMDILHLMGGG